MSEGEGAEEMNDTRKMLDEKGYVFLDDAVRPYHVRMWGGAPWLFYWHVDNHWVSLRQVDQTYVWQTIERALPDDQAELYHRMNAEYSKL
jgi:hypothetical protein